MTARPRARKIADAAVIALLLGATWLPLVGTTLLGRFRGSANDLRELAALPELRLERRALRAFPAQFEEYWNDHFGFRATLIRCLNVAKVRWLGVSTSPNVLFGRAPWLFYTHVPAGQNYDEVRPFTADELARWQRVLEERQFWLAGRGCKYLLFIPPDKQTIYPEHTDPALRPLHPESRLEQLVRHLRQHSTVPVLDIRAPMREAKARERLYHVTDSHWNDRGAFVGYQHLAADLAEWFPQVRPWPRSAFREVTAEKRGDLATLIDLSERRPEESLDLVPLKPRRARRSEQGVVWPDKVEFPMGKPFAMECDDPGLPRAVVFHDSFIIALQPFLSEHFRRTAYLWHDDFHADVVARERPDVVIHQLLERKLGFVVPNELKPPPE
jgi:alginate O-acetyltransferase complex protein AlgJ